MRTMVDVCNMISDFKCLYCPVGTNRCYTWDICTGHYMEILAYNMVRRGEY